MPTARYMKLMDKAERREITPAEMQELRKIGDEWIKETTDKFRQENPGWKNARLRSVSLTPPPGVPRSKHWLDEIRRFYGVDENHPRVARVFALIQKAETGGTIAADEAEEFRKEIDLLQDDLIAIWNAAHPSMLQLHREKPVSKFTETYWRYLISGPDKPPVPHEPTEDGLECKKCGLKKDYWERRPDCSRVKPPHFSPEAREAFCRRLEGELQQARKFVERAVSERQKEIYAKGAREIEAHLDKLNSP